MTRFLPKLLFFSILLAWIAAKVAVSFPEEFPALGLLCKWDCGWYESIARQGYLSPIPPLFQDSEHSNVAFFPAYPLLGRALAFLLGIDFRAALPLVSILCAIGVSIALARLLARETRASRFVRYAILVAYPTSFYLFVSYSEALYLAAMLGGASILIDDRDRTEGAGRIGGALLIAFGLALGATRLTGFVIPAFLFLGALLLRDPFPPRATRFLSGAVAGTAAFFLYCAIRFGHWNLYFWQLSLGWYKEFSPAKALGILLHAPFPPTLDSALLLAESRRLSWMLITAILLVSIYAAIRALRSARAALATADRPLLFRCALVFAALAHFFIVVCGDVGPWDAWGNGLRYPMPTVYLLAVAWRDEWTPKIVREYRALRWLAFGALGVVLAWLFSLQTGYLERFIRNEWVS